MESIIITAVDFSIVFHLVLCLFTISLTIRLKIFPPTLKMWYLVVDSKGLRKYASLLVQHLYKRASSAPFHSCMFRPDILVHIAPTCFHYQNEETSPCRCTQVKCCTNLGQRLGCTHLSVIYQTQARVRDVKLIQEK